MTLIKPMPELSLLQAGQSKASRSFHIGNLTQRDLLPIIAGCQGETFDLNKITDKAYNPLKIVYKKRIYDLFTAANIPPSDVHTPSMGLPIVPDFGEKYINDYVASCAENAVSLNGFWMNINRGLGIGEFVSFSQKITNNTAIAKSVLEKITSHYATQPDILIKLWSRYLTRSGETIPARGFDKDSMIYVHPTSGEEYRVQFADIVTQSLICLSHLAGLATSKSDGGDIYHKSYATGPIFANEVTAVVSYTIDALQSPNDTTLHVGGQAMFSYVKGERFLDIFKELLTIVDDDHDITNGVKLNGFGVIPAHYYRFIGYDDGLLESLDTVFRFRAQLQDLNIVKGALFKQGNTIKSIEVQAVIKEIERVRNENEILIKQIALHQEIQDIPRNTRIDGGLNQLYHSQLDLLDAMNKGFNPHEKRLSIITKTGKEIHETLNKPLSLI